MQNETHPHEATVNTIRGVLRAPLLLAERDTTGFVHNAMIASIDEARGVLLAALDDPGSPDNPTEQTNLVMKVVAETCYAIKELHYAGDNDLAGQLAKDLLVPLEALATQYLTLSATSPEPAGV